MPVTNMKTLEITPIKDKKIVVLIIEKEYNEPFWLTEPPSISSSKLIQPLLNPSIGFYRFLENLTKEVKPDFVTDELGMRLQKEFYEDNILARLFQKSDVPYYPVDIDEAAKGYLAENLDKKKELREKDIKRETERIIRGKF